MAKFITDTHLNKGRGDIRNFIIFVDEPVEKGGSDKAPTPAEYLLLSLASCMAITMKLYADRKKWNVGKINIECNYDEDENGNKIITKKIDLEMQLNDEDEQRLVLIGSRCLVSKMINLPIKRVK